MDYLQAFLVGGVLCAIGQILIDKTKLTPARILAIYVSGGVILTAFGLYEYVVQFGGAGATVPLVGFGYALAKGTFKAVKESGLTGVFSGGVIATSAGISAAVFFGFLFAIIFKPKVK